MSFLSSMPRATAAGVKSRDHYRHFNPQKWRDRILLHPEYTNYLHVESVVKVIDLLVQSGVNEDHIANVLGRALLLCNYIERQTPREILKSPETALSHAARIRDELWSIFLVLLGRRKCTLQEAGMIRLLPAHEAPDPAIKMIRFELPLRLSADFLSKIQISSLVFFIRLKIDSGEWRDRQVILAIGDDISIFDGLDGQPRFDNLGRLLVKVSFLMSPEALPLEFTCYVINKNGPDIAWAQNPGGNVVIPR